MLHDLRFALRSLLKSPGFTVASVLTLALGIGATTAIFSVLYAVLFRPFPYPDAERLAVLRQKGPQFEMSIAWPTVQDWMKEQQSFSALAVHRRDRFNLSGSGQLPENINGAYASASLFAVAALPPVLGRYYTAEDDKPGAAPVAVVSETLWTRRYGRNPGLIGQTIPVDGIQRTVIGIAPAGLGLPRASEIWVPIFPHAATQESWQSRGNNPGLYSFGRLKPGLTLAQAQADLERIYTGLRALYPDELTGITAAISPYRENQVGSFRAGLLSLLVATGFVLAIACANVASLFITRGIRQERNYAVRTALGASRFQLMRHLLTESLAVAVLGGALAVLLAWWSLGAIQRFAPPDTARFQNIEINRWVLGFSLLIAAASGVLAGLWPSLRLSRADVRGALHEGSRGSTAGNGLRRILVGAQVALTLVLLSVSGLMLRSLERMQHAALGFDGSSTLTFSVALPESRYRSRSASGSGIQQNEPAQQFFQTLTERLRGLPGVGSASVSTTPPLHAHWQSSHSIEGVVYPDARRPLAEMGIVSDDYFNTLRVPLLQGRAFDARDATGPRVVIIDQAFAQSAWPGQNPLGQRVNWGVSDRDEENWFTVIGVVPTLRVYGYDRPAARPQAYWSLRQFGPLQSIALVRTQNNPRLLERQIRELLAQLDPNIAIYSVATMQEEIEATYRNTTLQSFLLSLFAGLALLLALTGLYGVVAYGVSLRRREIGVRMALGAQDGQVVALMLRQGLVPLLIGLATGLLGAALAGRLIRSQLYEVSPLDPGTLAATALLLAVAAIVACWLPARRAAKVDPMIALRAE